MTTATIIEQKTDLVPILLICPNPYQPESRLKFPDEVVQKMAASIEERGLVQMPVVRLKHGAKTDRTSRENAYEMGDGWLRLCAYRYLAQDKKLQGYNAIPVVIRELTDRQMADMVIDANTVRQDMTPIDLAKFYKKYLEDFKITQGELAKLHNSSQGEIANTIRLLELPEEVQGKVISREISESHGRQLLRLNPMPEFQKEMLNRTVKQNFTINQLDQTITRSLWDNTRSLKPNNYGFDVKTCDSCWKRIMAADPWGDQKKQYRCTDTECWDKKQNEAEAVRAAKLQEKAGAAGESTGVKKILTGNDLCDNQYQSLADSHLKELDNPEQCKTCDKTAMYRYRADDIYKPERVCLNPNCFRQKKARKTREVHKVEKQQDQELTAKLGETFRSLTDHKAIAVVLAKDLLRYPKLNMDGEADMLTYFPDLPADKKKRLDDDAIKKWLHGQSLDDLLQICAAAVITHSRRQSFGFYNTKLDGNAKENYAILTAVKSAPGSKVIPDTKPENQAKMEDYLENTTDTKSNRPIIKSDDTPGQRKPSGIPFEELIQVGTIVKTSYNTGPYRVEKISKDKNESFSLVCSDLKAKRKKDGSLPAHYGYNYLNKLVAVDGRILNLFERNKDEVFILDPENESDNKSAVSTQTRETTMIEANIPCTYCGKTHCAKRPLDKNVVCTDRISNLVRCGHCNKVFSIYIPDPMLPSAFTIAACPECKRHYEVHIREKDIVYLIPAKEAQTVEAK